MLIKPFRAVYPNLDFVASADSFVDAVKEQYQEYCNKGFFQKAPQEALYVYQIRTSRRNFTGLIACANIKDFFEGKIKKHENTIAEGEQTQMQLLISRGAAVKPVLQAYRDVPEINQLFDEIIATQEVFFKMFFEKSKEEHLFWQVSDGATIQKIQELFSEKIPFTYIADGHHRTTTTALLYERMREKKKSKAFDYLLTVYFPSSQLEIFAFNRLIEGLGELSMTAFMAKISQVCDIEQLQQPTKPSKKHQMIMYLNREWYRLTWKESVVSTFDTKSVLLDVSLLNEKILKDIFGIVNVRSDERVLYIEGPKGWEGLRSKMARQDSVAFYLYPVKLEDLMHIADEGKTLPPKSTWFEPRIKNGLVIYEF
jgi:uncharacterized protein (DUF1015 family)